MSDLPPLYGINTRRSCDRALARRPNGQIVNCGAEPSHHVIWNEHLENGLVCFPHAQEAARRWKPLQIHAIAPDCGMPGSVWEREEQTCRVPSEDDPVRPILLELAEAST